MQEPCVVDTRFLMNKKNNKQNNSFCNDKPNQNKKLPRLKL